MRWIVLNNQIVFFVLLSPTSSCVVVLFPYFHQAFIVSLSNWRRWFMIRVNGVSCCWMVSGLNSPSLLWSVLSQKSSVPGFMGVRALHDKILLLNKTAECEFACMADPHQRQWGREEGLLVHIFPVFLHPRTLLWSICNCLWKNRRQVLLPPVFCVVLTVQCGRGMLAISIKLLPNKGLNWNHICADISLLALEELMFLPC